MPTTTTTTTITLSRPLIGAKLIVFYKLEGIETDPKAEGFPTITLPSQVSATIRLTSGGRWWEASALLQVNWTLNAIYHRDVADDYLYTGEIVSSATSETSSEGTLFGLAPNANDPFSKPDGLTLITQARHQNGAGDWTYYNGSFVTPARLFPMSGSVDVTITTSTVQQFNATDNAGLALPRAPVATVGTTTITDDTVTLQNTSQAGAQQIVFNNQLTPNLLSGAQITSSLWDWKDGATTQNDAPNALANATHQYADGGFYNIGLTVTDSWGMTASTSKFIQIVAEAGRMVSLVCDPSGFYVAARTTGAGVSKALSTLRWNGLAWETLNSSSLLHRAALGLDRERGRILRLAQRIAEKDWPLSATQDLGSTWSDPPIATPFDSTHKATTRPVDAGGVLKCAALDASNIIRVKTSMDGGTTWTLDAQSPGSGAKSIDMDWDGDRSRLVIVVDGGTTKYTSDLTGATAWLNL